MLNKNQKTKKSEKAARISACVLMYVLLALFVGVLLLFSSNYAKIYDSPRIDRGRADFSGVDLPSRDVACNLAGEWEFFYDKFIVTDGYDGEADGMMNLPGLWTYRDFGSGRLSGSGYASYRLTVENVQPDIDVSVYRYYCNFAYRVFINGELNFRSGTVSKSADETVITGYTSERYPYRTDGGPLEIVIEVAAGSRGGFNTAPWLAAVKSGPTYGSSLRSFNYVALGITTAAVIVAILGCLFFRYKRDFSMPAFLVALYVHFLTSKDLLYVFATPITLSHVLSLLSAIAAFALLAVHLWRNGAGAKKPFVIATSASAAVFTALLVAFYGTPVAPVFAFLLLSTACAYLAPLMLGENMSGVQKGLYGALFIFLISIFCFEMCDVLGLLVFGTEFIFTFELMFIIACFAALWLWKLARTAQSAIRVSELECELNSLKNRALQTQIKPHFVYNSLTAIQARYREGLREGDKAIEQFAKHLRLITDSRGDDVIPFDDEVVNVMNYFELENMRSGGNLDLILDVDYTDFSVPVLSLQPLVENAIRHGGLRERRDGYIQLSSFASGGNIVVEVSDNGSGFDPDTVAEGVGLANTRKRFELMHAEMTVESSPGGGTKVTVKIPLENSDENNSGRR